MIGYLVFVAVVFGVNLLPAFGPPTWALLVFFRLNSHLAPVALVLLGAVAAAAGRLLLAQAFGHLRGRLSEQRQRNLDAAATIVQRDRKRSILGLGLFALSPVPSAQLFEAAGLIGMRLLPLIAAFFAGRIVSYSLYVAGASAAKNTSAGSLVTSSFTSPWGIAVQVILLLCIAGLARIDWAGRLTRHAKQQPRPHEPGRRQRAETS